MIFYVGEFFKCLFLLFCMHHKQLKIKLTKVFLKTLFFLRIIIKEFNFILDSSQPETHDDEKEKQPAHDVTETEFILDPSKKCDLSNFRFCGNKMKTSINESGKLQNSKNEEYDVYHKTNALGYVIGVYVYI